ncbi:MAG: Cof-type HAD-IIB family hydrolase [bacterium]|nr:Cof-type HAD-IIB family hydrolase [bacterium]
MFLFNIFNSANFEVAQAKSFRHKHKKVSVNEDAVNNVVKKIDISSHAYKINYVFADIDGTLIPFGSGNDGYIPSSVIDAAKILEDSNINFVLISGRTLYEIKQIADSLGLKKSYIVGNQGAEILTPHGAFVPIGGFSKSVLDDVLKEVENFNKKNNSDVFPFIHANGKVFVFKQITLPFSFDEYVVIKSTEEIGDNFNAVKIGLYNADLNLLLKLQKDLKEKFPNYSIVNSSPTFIDFLSKETSKGNAIKYITSKLNIPLRQVAVFGDSENDISMLSLVASQGGLAVAVDNAQQSVKDNSNYITDSVDNDGFFNAVLLIVKNNKKLTPVRTNPNSYEYKRN